MELTEEEPSTSLQQDHQKWIT